MYHPIRHLCVITRHRHCVIAHGFRAGIGLQSLLHDLSKYSPTEFWNGAKFYQGTRSPNNAEREKKGYSEAWMHHKGRNRHHYEYWTDVSKETGQYESLTMPRKYLVEMVMDRRAACLTYEGVDYTDGSALRYFRESAERNRMHPKTRQELD